jgi:hypothetical protein
MKAATSTFLNPAEQKNASECLVTLLQDFRLVDLNLPFHDGFDSNRREEMTKVGLLVLEWNDPQNILALTLFFRIFAPIVSLENVALNNFCINVSL